MGETPFAPYRGRFDSYKPPLWACTRGGRAPWLGGRDKGCRAWHRTEAAAVAHCAKLNRMHPHTAKGSPTGGAKGPK